MSKNIVTLKSQSRSLCKNYLTHSIKFGEKVAHRPQKNPLDFGGNSGHVALRLWLCVTVRWVLRTRGGAVRHLFRSNLNIIIITLYNFFSYTVVRAWNTLPAGKINFQCINGFRASLTNSLLIYQCRLNFA